MKRQPTSRETSANGSTQSATGRVTYYVALPFTRDEQGDFVAGEAAEFQGSRPAIASAHALALKHGGAVAFSRSGDPAIGEFEDAVVLSAIGDVPPDLAAFTG